MDQRRCREIIVSKGEECGRKATATVAIPGHPHVCGIHARAAEARGEGVYRDGEER